MRPLYVKRRDSRFYWYCIGKRFTVLLQTEPFYKLEYNQTQVQNLYCYHLPTFQPFYNFTSETIPANLPLRNYWSV